MWVVGDLSFNLLVTLIWSDNLCVPLDPFILDVCGGVVVVVRGGPGGVCRACVLSERGNHMGCMDSAIHLLRLWPAWPSANNGCMYSIWVV